MAFCVSRGLLVVGEAYRAAGGKGRGSFCKTYSFPPDISAQSTVQVVTTWQPRRFARKRKTEETAASLSPAQSYVWQNVQKLTVAPGWESAGLSEDAKPGLARIAAGDFHVTSDANGRLHHNLTNLDSDARPFLRLNGAPLVGVDYSAFHPHLILSLAKDADERAKLAEWLAGDFYTRLIDLDFSARRTVNPRVRPMARQTAKKGFNSAVNDEVKNEGNYRIFAVFAREFPKTAQIVRDLKSNDYRDAACVLQRMESNLVFSEVVTALHLKGVPCLSLHDCIYSAADHTETVRHEMESAAWRLLRVRITAKAG
jgi:hypothetical protein